MKEFFKKRKKALIIAGLSIFGLMILGGVLAFIFIFQTGKSIGSLLGFTAPSGTDSGAPQLSHTTGLPYSGTYKPVMAVIENSPPARPQLGLQTADVVYEFPVEGVDTRFVCVFSDKVPEQILPVRSGRAPFLYVQAEWDAMFMHFGGSGSGNETSLPYTFYGNSLHGSIKIDLEGITIGYKSGMFKRVDTAAAPHNVMANPLMAQKSYTYDPKPLDWLFDASAYYPGEVASEVSIPFTTRNSTFLTYVYDSTSDTYLRSMGGKPFIAGETGQQLKVKNLIVQHANYTIQGGNYKDWQMVGSGKAEYYIGGMLIRGTWSKASPTAPTLFVDAQGKPIVLKPGNTWIHINPN